MSKYKMPFHYDVHWGYIDKCLELDPMDYIEYDTVGDVKDAVYDSIWDSIDTGDLDVDQSGLDYKLPDDFIVKWKEIKGYE